MIFLFLSYTRFSCFKPLFEWYEVKYFILKWFLFCLLIIARWQQVDSNGKGTLDYGEFVAVSLHLRRMANDDHLHKAFSYFDKDGNGYIEPDELRNALMEDGAEDCTDVANDIFLEVDTDKVDIWEISLYI